jgi:hypothetical protein
MLNSSFAWPGHILSIDTPACVSGKLAEKGNANNLTLDIRGSYEYNSFPI